MYNQNILLKTVTRDPIQVFGVAVSLCDGITAFKKKDSSKTNFIAKLNLSGIKTTSNHKFLYH